MTGTGSHEDGLIFILSIPTCFFNAMEMEF